MSYEKKKNIEGKTKEILDSAKNFNFKDRFGSIPKSIMTFKKDKELMELIDWDNSEIGKIEGDAKRRGGGYAKELRYSIYNPAQAYFIIDYYTRNNDIILDPFSGRVTRPLISLYLNRKYIGYDTSRKTIELNNTIISKKFPEKKEYKMVYGDGTELKELESKENFVDAVFTCPPYYNIEKYSGENGDLSYLSIEEYNLKINTLFKKLYRLIKKSNYKKLEFYPVIITVGSVRRGQAGLLDMDFIFQEIAKKIGFTLHDKMFTENLTPGAGFTFRRNYCYKFVTKNYETTLIFLKYGD
jgi:DNA modification methylase